MDNVTEITDERQNKTIALLAPDPFIKSAYGILAGEMARRLKADGYNVVILGNQHTSAPVTWEGITVTPYLKDGFLRDCLEYWIDEYKINVIVSIFNFWVMEHLVPLKQKGKIKYICWTPVEGKLNRASMSEDHHAILNNADAIITTCNFVKEQLANAGHDSTVVYSAVSDKLKILPYYETRKEMNIPEKEFMVGFVGRNFTERKLIPYVIKIFADFLEKLPEEERSHCTLYLHTNREYASRTYDLDRLVGYFGLKGRVMLPKRQLTIDPVDDEQMNKIYNTMDVFLFPSMGEGFNVPLAEAMYLSIPCIVHDAHAHAELIADTEVIHVPSKMSFWPLVSGMIEEMQLPDLDIFVQELYQFYIAYKENKGIGMVISARAADKAAAWTWDNSYKGFKEVLGRVIKEEKKEDLPN